MAEETKEGYTQEMENRKVTVRVNQEENVAIKEDLAADLIAQNIYVRIYMAVIWVVATAVMCKFIYDITMQYESGKTSPSSSINIQVGDVLPAPKVVVCNWNQDGSVQNPAPTYTCPECLVTLVSCLNLNTSEDCSGLWENTPIETKAGLFDCYTYNGHNDTPINSTTTGYSGAIASVWSVKLLPFDASPLNRAGLQASFFLLDGTPTDPNAIYDEIRFAPVSLDTFFAVRYINTLHTEDNPQEGVIPNSSRYDTLISSVNLLTVPSDAYGYIGVSFSFQTLNEEVDIFFTSYTLQNFWGDFAGMVGTLMGLDVIKVASGIPVTVVSVRFKSLNPLEEHFNG